MVDLWLNRGKRLKYGRVLDIPGIVDRVHAHVPAYSDRIPNTDDDMR